MDIKQKIDRINVYNLMIFNLTVLSIIGIIKFNWFYLINLIVAIFSAGLFDSIIYFFKTKKWKISKSGIITGFFIGMILLNINQKDFYIPLIIGFLAIILKHTIKYMLSLFKQNTIIFNPAILGIFIATLFFSSTDGWWGASNLWMIIILGIFLVYKFKRFDLVLSFLISYFIISAIIGINFISILSSTTIYFFAFFMLTEPKTTPFKKTGKIVYGILTAKIIILISKTQFSAYSLTAGLLLSNISVPIINKFSKV